ncbi:MAG: methylated-DNA--[protein]-cysteine S-methyltransferase [Euryarchaeota archaeon]|nr:methylated-DNA--[protein]-cysteine S-methyltransferase [Euryarchaeota archaeon]
MVSGSPVSCAPAISSMTRSAIGLATQLPTQLGDLTSDLIRHLSGEVVDFSGYLVDLSHLTDFEQSVLCETRKIEYGSMISYSELAREIGRPKTARAVGNALRKNPMPIVIPCHRVVAQHGIGGYVLGVDLKRRLLELEGNTIQKSETF